MANMSGVMEKTLSSLPGLFVAAVKGKSHDSSQDQFRKFMKSVEQVKSRQEEEQVVLKQAASLKEKLANPQISNVQKRHSLAELLFCYMLGYDVSFSYIHAVKLAQQGHLLDKRTGYLLCSLFMNETHELSMLLINTIHKDLKSSDILVISSALSATCQLVSSEMIPAILPLVEEKLGHSSAVIRKKAMICMHQFYRKAADLVQSSEPSFIKALCDKDPGVMWAAVHLYLDLIKGRGAEPYRKMVGVFSDILMQVVSRKLPLEYDYRSVPAPWLTISLLRILALLGKQSESTSMQMYPVLREVSQRTEPTHTIGLAVISECVETICAIHPESSLLQFASKVVARFLSAQNINIRYIGLRALSQLVSVDLKYTVDHQKAVIEFLEHEDLTVQRQTFHLLFRMANPKNIEVITKKLLDCLKQSSDQYLHNDIVAKVLSLTQRYSNEQTGYAECTEWYLNTINELLTANARELPDNVVSSILDVLDKKSERTLQTAVRLYWSVLQEQHLPDSLVQLACWVASSHFHSTPDLSSVQVSSCLLSWLPRSTSSDTQRVILVGLSRLLPKLPQEQLPLFIESIEASLKNSGRETLQMMKELKALARTPDILLAVTNKDSEEKMDFTLSFLDDYVCQCLENGDCPYKPASYRAPKHLQLPDQSLTKTSLRLTPYDSPLVDSSSRSVSPGHSLSLVSSTARSADSTDSKSLTDLQLKGVKRVWGKEGFRKESSQLSKESENNRPEKCSHSPYKEKRTEDERRRDAFTSALFSGIDPTDKDLRGDASSHNPFNTTSLATTHVPDTQPEKDEDDGTYTQLIDPVLSTVHSNTGPLVDHCSTNGIIQQGHVQHLDHFTTSSQETPYNVNLSLPKQTSTTGSMALSHVIRDVAFETDSLDGSLDLDAPPLLFHSEHEDVPVFSSQDDLGVTNSELFSSETEES